MKGKSHGGSRPGAGRPRGSGKFGEKTIPVRVPESLAHEVLSYISNHFNEKIDSKLYSLAHEQTYYLPLYNSGVAAGSPTEAGSDIREHVNIASRLIKRPKSTFLVHARGDSMIDAGIFDGDLLVVDKAETVSQGKIVVAALDGALTVKTFSKTGSKIVLLPANKLYPAIEVGSESSLVIWGVVTSVVHEV